MKAYSGIVTENNLDSLGELSAGEHAQTFRLPENFSRGQLKHLPKLSGMQLFVKSELDSVAINWSLQHTYNRRNEVQQIELNTLSSGSYRLAFLDQVTEEINYDDVGSSIKNKLQALSNIADNIDVVGREITFIGNLSGTNVPMLEVFEITGKTMLGEWSATTSYSTNDVVSSLGKNYVAIQGSLDKEPSSNSDYWQLTVSVREAIPAYQWLTVAQGSQDQAFVSKESKGWVDIEFDAEVTAQNLNEDWRLTFNMPSANLCYSAYQNNLLGRLTQKNETPIIQFNQQVCGNYRLLSEILDEGIDFLGNQYRGSIKSYLPKEVANEENTIWLSKPNPSKFAVESLYLDIREDGSQSVVNKLMIDPVTPGIFCNVYYSTMTKGSQEWDNLIWRPIVFDLHLTAKHTFNLPEPIVGNYIKLEFTKLQARSYRVGDYQQKVTYKKHPKWVLDYFYNIYIGQKNRDIASDQVIVQYNALSLYYNYFIDDIVEFATFPRSVDRTLDDNILNDYFSLNQDSSQLDSSTINGIKLTNKGFEMHPVLATSSQEKSLLRQYNYPKSIGDYSAERVSKSMAVTDLVTSDDRASVQMDREFPSMSFYIPCRHQYRVSKGKFANDKAYFAGIKQIGLQRDYYASVSDEWVYSETAGDETNIESNDLSFENGAWTGKGSG